MRSLLSLFVLLLSSTSVWATQEILYERSPTVCANNGDGTAYACAASPGAVGAFSGTNNILFHATDETAGRADPGDIVYVCGLNLITTASFRITPTVSGTAGNPITISGACPNDPGILDGNSVAAGIRLINLGSSGPINYFTVTNLTFQNVIGNDYTMFCYDAVSSGAYDRFITISHNTFTNLQGTAALWCWGSEFTITDNTFDLIGNDAIYIKGGKNTVVTDNHLTRISFGAATGDCIQFDSSATHSTIGTGTVSIARNVCDKHTSPNVKYGIVVGPVTGRTTVEDNVIYCPIATTSSTGCNPIYVNAAGSGSTAEVVVQRNFVSKGWRGITIATANNTAFRHQLVGNVMVGLGTFGSWIDGNSDNVDIINNTFCDNAQYGLYLGKTNTTHLVKNNVFCRNGTGMHYINIPGQGHSYNDFYGNITTAIDDANGPKSIDATDITSNPVISPTYRLGKDSVVKRAGQPDVRCQDVGHRPCWVPPDMGAYQTSRGDPANTRSTRIP